MTARAPPRLTCQFVFSGGIADLPPRKCGYEADSHAELRAHMEASHGGKPR